MRVLHIDSGKEMRGGQWQVLHLLSTLGNGHQLLCAADGPLMSAALERGIDARPLTVTQLLQLSRTADLIHAHDARSHTWAASLCYGRIIVSRRVAFPVGQSWLSRWKYRRPSHFIAVSHYVKSTLHDAGVAPENVSVVYDGVPLPPRRGDGELILAPASADPMKGTDLLDEAARLAGIRIKYSHDLPADLHNARLFVYITRAEGLGSAALLAMAAGVPVVASRVGGLPEIVREGETGLLTSNDPAEIAAVIHQALSNRGDLCCKARDWVERNCTIERMAANTSSVYEKVLAC